MPEDNISHSLMALYLNRPNYTIEDGLKSTHHLEAYCVLEEYALRSFASKLPIHRRNDCLSFDSKFGIYAADRTSPFFRSTK